MSALAQARVVLCGGIGSGKSTVGTLLAARGAFVIDADEVGHRVLEPGGRAFDPVAGRWPSVVVDNAIDRGALGRIVFDDAAQLAELEAITTRRFDQTSSSAYPTSTRPSLLLRCPFSATS